LYLQLLYHLHLAQCPTSTMQESDARRLSLCMTYRKIHKLTQSEPILLVRF